MPDSEPRSSAKMRLSLLLFVADLADPSSPLAIVAEDAGLGVRAELRVEPIGVALTGLPHPKRDFSDLEQSVMLAIGRDGAKLGKAVNKMLDRPDNDVRLKTVMAQLRSRGVLGHCPDGYFWVATNPDIDDDGAD